MGLLTGYKWLIVLTHIFGEHTRSNQSVVVRYKEQLK
jgi:hypothetical protein